MLTLEFKAYGKPKQLAHIDEAIRTAQFIQNKCLRFWLDNPGVTKYDLNKYTAILAKEFPFAANLNSTARQSAAERCGSAITRFFKNCKQKIPGKKGFPKFKKTTRSVEFKQSGWKLSENRKRITFTDKNRIGSLKLKGTRDLHFYSLDQIKRVRLLKKADGYYVQFCIKVNREESVEATGKSIGLDVGLKEFYTDSNGISEKNPRFFRQGEQDIKRLQRRVSRRVKGSNNRRKARQRLGRRHLKISRQRQDFVVKLARCVIQSNDCVVYEDLRIKNMVRNHCLAKSINDASWYQFRLWLEYFAQVFGKITIAVAPNGTSQDCSRCGTIVKKSLSTRTHVCRCGCELDRDHNAAINILQKGMGTVGHTGTNGEKPLNASGEMTSTLVGAILSEQVAS
ncbi:RNA-guided endonuclease InsQ/TnpB family protein [Spirulina major]|uniref:RNA-guided endonuclease InsQ/TnpB family protein n=1 Tax=Spirulina major TaxID=270636 RepID=UPI0009328CB1|nr:RNA-guided endonuclease TnpB family protein [Spirulina major]